MGFSYKGRAGIVEVISRFLRFMRRHIVAIVISIITFLGAVSVGNLGMPIASTQSVKWFEDIAANGYVRVVSDAGVTLCELTDVGDVECDDGTFSGDVSAVDGIFSGDISAVDGSFSGDVDADDGSFSGNVTLETDGAWVGRDASTSAAFDNVADSITLSVQYGSSRLLNNAGGYVDMVGGSWSNSVSTLFGGGAVCSGGNATFPNTIAGYGDGATIGGGIGNEIQNPGQHATISGGAFNTTDGNRSTIGGGYQNTIDGSPGDFFNDPVGNSIFAGTLNSIYVSAVTHGDNVVVGGQSNSITNSEKCNVNAGSYNVITNSLNSFIGGGSFNNVIGILPIPVSEECFIGSGDNNTLTDCEDCFIGTGDTCTGTGASAFIGSGDRNDIDGDKSAILNGTDCEIDGDYSAVAIGSNTDITGNYSFANGRRAKVTANGCFIWGDSTNADVTCANANRTIFRSAGGYYIYTNGALGTGMYLAAGGSAWNAVSDRESKSDFEDVDGGELLQRIADMPTVETWKYKDQEGDILHVGAMADEFNGLVDGLGGEGADKINQGDAIGVNLAAIQALVRRVDDLEKGRAVTEIEAYQVLITQPHVVVSVSILVGSTIIAVAILLKRR